MKNLFENTVRNLLCEDGNFTNRTANIEMVSENPSDGFYLYHCANESKSALENIALMGNRRQFTNTGTGNGYGDGIYTTYTLKSSVYNAEEDLHGRGWGTPHQCGKEINGMLVGLDGKPIRNAGTRKYGHAIVKVICTDDLRDYLIFDPLVCRAAHGDDKSIEDQIKYILRNQQTLLSTVLRDSDNAIRRMGHYYTQGRHTASGAVIAWREFLRNYRRANIRQYIKGLIFSGNRDGNVCVVYNFSSCHPIAISLDMGKTFEKVDTENYIYQSIANNEDLERVLGHIYDEFRSEGFSNGYAVVGLHHKYRILCQELYDKKINIDGRISSLFFDKVYGMSFSEGKERKIKVEYEGIPFIIKRVSASVYDVYDEYGHYLCGLEDLSDYVSKLDDNNPQQSNMDTEEDDFDFSNIDFDSPFTKPSNN